ncbi:MAG: DUF4981 domain-containing protein [Opitutales bacterium]|nr:DUF4981 domain-containing protein [Opitutales bacterium]
MKKLLALLASIAAATFVFADLKGSNPTDSAFVFEDIETFKINKEEPRAFFISYPDFASASKKIGIEELGNIYETPNYMLLNGGWKFLFLNSADGLKPEYVAANFDDSKWDNMEVPNSWQCGGYDRIFYANVPAEFQFNMDGSRKKGYEDSGADNPSESILNPTIPPDHRQAAVYRRNFALPKNWHGGEIFLRFNGVRTGFKVYVNGKFAGYSEDSFTPAEFDISSLLKEGENSVSLIVYKYSTGGFFEMQDMPHLSGIIRDAMLIRRPKVHLRDYFSPAKISEDLKSAEIDFEACVRNLSGESAKNFSIRAEIFDENSKPLSSFLIDEKLPEIKAGSEVKFSKKIRVKDFKLWSPDKPNLYAILISVCGESGEVLETVRADYAFKKFEVRGTGIFLNGKNVLFKGVNRHDWSPDKGKACPFKWMKRDAEMMKQININAVRTSHYPSDDLFYMLCARYGLMVLDECNQEQHGWRNTAPLDFDKFIPASVDRMRNMVLRDRNVPSVVIFSLGNESAGRVVKGHGEMAKVVRELSPLHYVHSEAECGEKLAGRDNGFSDFASPMYGGVDRMNGYLRNQNKKYPFFFCEYAHAMGNSIGNLKGKWDLIRENQDCLHGGFIWDWVDQSLLLPRENDPSKLYFSDGRDWNTKPSAGNFCLNGIVFADRSHSAKFYEVGRVYQDIQVSRPDESRPNFVKISNEFYETNLNEFDAILEVRANGKTVFERQLPPIDLPAGKSAELELDIPEFKENAEYFYALEFRRRAPALFADAGQVVSRTQFFLKDTRTFSELKARGRGVSVSKKDGGLVVSAGSFVYVFGEKSARLESLRCGFKPMIVSPLDFDISSAFIDNERGGEVAREFRSRNLDRLKTVNPSLSFEKLKGGALRVFCKKILANAMGEGFLFETVYTILPDATMQVCASARKINSTPENLKVPRIGVKIGLYRELENVEYYGRGWFANYEDRKEAADVGLYKSNVADFFEAFPRPQDTGNREEVRFMKIFSKDGFGVQIIAEKNPLPMAILPYTQEELASAKHPHNLPEPSQNELRIAWRVRGLGNNSCGPTTRPQFKPSFKGKVCWSFILKPLLPNSKNISADCAFPKPLSYSPSESPENLEVESLAPKPRGRWVSENAKIKYSSIDEKWSPKKDNLLSTGEGDFSFHTLKEQNPHLVLELARPENILSVEILNRADARGDRTSRLRMYVSADAQNWRKVWEDDDCKDFWLADFKTPVRAKFIKLEMQKNEFFHLKRLRVFAE